MMDDGDVKEVNDGNVEIILSYHLDEGKISVTATVRVMLPKALKHKPSHQNTLYTTPLIDLFFSLSLSLSFITLP